MKKAVACLLAISLTLQGPAGLAAGNTAYGQNRTATLSDAVLASSSNASAGSGGKGLAAGQNAVVETESGKEGNGEVRVEIRGVLPSKAPSEWEVFLISGEDGRELEPELIQIEATETVERQAAGSCTFTEVPNGKYELLVRDIGSRGYLDYEQDITVKSDRVSLLLLNDYPQKYGYAGEALPGVIKLGDVNGDGRIDDEDRDTLVDFIDLGDEASADSRCDLNGDGMVDLADLQYFTLFYQNRRNSEAAVTRQAIVEPDTITASASNASVDENAVQDAFSGRETVLTLEADEAITKENPVEITAEFGGDLKANGFAVAPVTGSGNSIVDGEITVAYEENGAEKNAVFVVKDGAVVSRRRLMQRSALRSADDGALAGKTIVIDLGKQVAIKKVSIKVTATMKQDARLVEISRVEFLNDMETRIPEPRMDIPEKVTAEAGSESFDLSWKRAVNVTGYEVEITGKVKSGAKTAVISVSDNSLHVESIENEDLINGETYTVRVQSVNGDWRSGYSEAVNVTPEAVSRPDPPEGVTVKSGYRYLNVSWKKMKNTDSYTVFYREYGDTEVEYQKISGIEDTSQQLVQLKDDTKYEIYLTGTNKKGESKPSQHYIGKTDSIDPAVTPNYKLINVVEENGRTAHIEAVDNHGGSVNGEFDLADGDYMTAWVRNDWDAGCVYPDERKSAIVTFDDSYTMDTLILVPDQAQQFSYTAAAFYYWPEGSSKSVQAAGTLSRRTSSNGKVYYEFQTKEPVTAHRVQVRLTNSYGGANRISIAEMKFYYYDSVEDEIYGLFADDMHISLRTGVTKQEIAGLRERLNQPDEVSGEYHPKKELLEAELATAEQLLLDEAMTGVMKVDTHVTKNGDGNITFRGGLNAWQPLGVTAMAGDTVMVYVGSPSKKTGDPVNVKLIATQYHGESNAWSKDLGTLRAGANEITIPKITDLDVEQGGQLYLEYTGAQDKESYSVRVSGGHLTPVLDLTKASDSNAARTLVERYVEELEAYDAAAETLHEELHGGSLDAWGAEQKNCILGSTDIVTRFLMFSVPSSQILKGLNGATVQEKAKQLYQSLTAADDMVNLFYQHKGLSDAPDAGNKNRLPVSRLNLRYQRMFAGAFMYAGGLHIGIEWGSIPGLTKAVPVTATEEGMYVDGHYFGWGIAHEIGHEINEGAYAIAEITNNYFSVLSQARDTNDSVRFRYPDVYQKVTSGVKGRASSVFTQLGLYWQLHLAYDRGGYNYKTYETYGEQFDNLFFARVDSFVRDPAKAPQPGGVALTLNGTVDNKLMRLSCAAAQKNILEFFDRWGMVPDETTKAYAAQFPKETRAIWFVNDEARVYAMEHGTEGSVAADTLVSARLSYEENSNEVVIRPHNDAKKPEAMLGYEIYRSEYRKDQVVRKPVGFITADQEEFVDAIATINNRVFTYDVVGYDKYLNATEPCVLEPVKVSHGGVIDTEGWTVTTNMVAEEDRADAETSPDVLEKTAIAQAIDGRKDTTYTGKTTADSNGRVAAPSVTIHLNREETVTGFTYTLTGAGTPITNYKVEVSSAGEEGPWTTVKTGAFAVEQGQLKGESQTVYFNKANDPWLYAYDAVCVRITAVNQKGSDISISEIGLLGQTGDNIDFAQADSIGILREDYHAGQGESGTEAVIPKGSLIFTGTYKGNPAYNVVLLFDENGQIVGGTDGQGNILAEQLIFAEVPEHGELGETSSGTWVYYIEPEYLNAERLPKRVRAELYRVDDAHSNQGERLVSDTLFAEMPHQLPEIVIRNDARD